MIVSWSVGDGKGWVGQVGLDRLVKRKVMLSGNRLDDAGVG